ncbi:unnamed protein product [Phytomonas sp. Hart1]|nr:unnamed protein product [Phytomonas sp. Hart1]|eukprot:CCW67530.1 unnamed protein product [Phytomonas sp. isolate Hart1]
MERPWYCRRIHGKIKRSINIDGTALYRVEETSCDCPLPSPFPPRRSRVVPIKGKSAMVLNRQMDPDEKWNPVRTIKDNGGLSYNVGSLPYAPPSIVVVAPKVDQENIDRSMHFLPNQESAIPTIPVIVSPLVVSSVRNVAASGERPEEDVMATPASPPPSCYHTTHEGVVGMDGISHIIPPSSMDTQDQANCSSFRPCCSGHVDMSPHCPAWPSSKTVHDLDVVRTVLNGILHQEDGPCELSECGMCERTPHEAGFEGQGAAAPSTCTEADDGLARCELTDAVRRHCGWWSGNAAVAIIHNHYSLK